jgi:hypothetical protein
MQDFVELLKNLLIMEYECSEKKAEMLIKKNPNIIMQGIMKGTFALNATAMALVMLESVGGGHAR